MSNNFRTVVDVPKFPFEINHEDTLMSIGSCFSESIGQQFIQNKFKSCINPFGQQYNPLSICNAINRLVSGKFYTADELSLHDELYHSFDHHGSFSRDTKEETIRQMNETLREAVDYIKRTNILFITLGTAHYFRWKENGNVVSNCHKIPASKFLFQLATPNEIEEIISATILNLRSIHPTVKIIFTVSPVRYFAFGHYENAVSKAHLFTAIHQVMQKQKDCFYFPAYEIIMDDLRDYRFYKEDLLHPNNQAIQYVWESLSNALFSTQTKSLINEIEAIRNASLHRPRNSNSDMHKNFVAKTLNKIELLSTKYGMDFTQEIVLLKK